MKPRNLALALTAAALMPTQVYAGDTTDETRASFDRTRNHEFITDYMRAAKAAGNPLAHATGNALR